MEKMPVARKKKIPAREAGGPFTKVTIRKPSREARKAADKIATILEEHLDTLPGPERAAKLKAFHASVSASFAVRATLPKRSKTEVPVFSRVAAQR